MVHVEETENGYAITTKIETTLTNVALCAVYLHARVGNRDSIKTKLSILDKYRLAGVAGWRKGHETPDVWDTIRTLVKNR